MGLTVICSVPQDSNLGPVLFNVFIHDQEAGVECIISVFADNTKLECCCSLLQDKRPCRRMWIDEHLVLINGMKCNKLKWWIQHLVQSSA